MKTEVVQSISTDLSKVVRGDVFEDIIHRAAFSTDASIYQITPDCVVAPRDSADVVAVIKYANNNNIAVVARGAGSGVAGESLSSGIVFDTKRYMNKILSIKDKGQVAVCQPGVVLDDLNDRLAKYGRKIGPDPSTSNRATIGGCVANNATGAHSLAYGYIGDYVESIEAVLADGSLVEFKNDFKPAEPQSGPADDIAQKCIDIISKNQQVIKKALPRTKRNRSGYTIADICHDGRIDLARMMAGSEGTLCIFTKITLRTVPIEPVKATLQLEFNSLSKMAEAVPIIVDTGASACELMDKTLIEMARDALPQYRDILPEKAVAVLAVEHTGQTKEQVKQKIKETDSAIAKLAAARKIVFDEELQKQIEKARKDAVPLLFRKKSRKKPIPFIEDVSVDNKQLGKYIAGLQHVARQYNFEMSLYGHAGDGELHVRPYLDLKDPAEVQKMVAIANDVFAIAWSLGGTISGEHADGLVRAAFIRNQYGEEFYELLRQIKKIFDPNSLINPGKIITDKADVMVSNLRAQHEILSEKLKTDLLYDKDELQLELEQCNGCGLCINSSADLRFCPVYRSVGEELASPRAKANLLRFWATGQIKDKDFESPEFRKFLDLCINCKACSVECPSGVDVSKLITEARTKLVKRKKLRKTEAALSHNRHLSTLGSTFPKVSNFAVKLEIFKWFLEKAAGFDKQRQIPKFANKSFLKAGNKYLESCKPITKPIDKVAYFTDTYVNYNDHELGFAVIDVLRHNNIEVILPRQRPAPLPAICYGDSKTVKQDLSYSAKYLAQAIRKGYKIICSEPSAVLCMKEEIKHFISGEDAKLVSKNTYELMSYLLDLYKQNKLKPIAKKITEKFAYHLPCHLYSVGRNKASIKLLEGLCGAKVTDLNAGCCGIAGTFGMQKKNSELSSRIATQLRKTLEKTKTKYVLTECSACKMQIEHISDKIVTHPIKILADSYE